MNDLEKLMKFTEDGIKEMTKEEYNSFKKLSKFEQQLIISSIYFFQENIKRLREV